MVWPPPAKSEQPTARPTSLLGEKIVRLASGGGEHFGHQRTRHDVLPGQPRNEVIAAMQNRRGTGKSHGAPMAKPHPASGQLNHQPLAAAGRAAPEFRRSRSRSDSQRWSNHGKTGQTGRSSASTNAGLGTCPPTPMAATRPDQRRQSRCELPRTVPPTNRCSVVPRPLRRHAWDSATRVAAAQLPGRSKRPHFSALVPRSMPMNSGSGITTQLV